MGGSACQRRPRVSYRKTEPTHRPRLVPPTTQKELASHVAAGGAAAAAATATATAAAADVDDADDADDADDDTATDDDGAGPWASAPSAAAAA
jgi:hypothetical protein